MTKEEQRLHESRERTAHWKRWGPYLSERQWGTVREDYSPYGAAWDSLPHDHARSRAYRWGEDGIAGISDRHQYICFALALWNGRDPILKERLFGLTGNEGNHGEDVKEYYFYLDSTPTHPYMKYLYKYPQAAFPYARLVEENRRRGKGDRQFLESVFHKLLLNFTWWVNRKDAEGRNVFQGGFLGLDNIGVFDRSAPLPTGGHIEQSDGTSWMGMYCLNMLAIAMELARENPAYENVASKFWEHFVYIAYAMNNLGGEGIELWNDQDGFYYDVLHLPNGEHFFLRVRSMVGLIPLFAVETLDPDLLNRLPGFKRRLEWFIDNRPDLNQNCACMRTPGRGERRLLSIVNPERLRRILRVMLDEHEFLSPYGIRALSRYHLDHPYTLGQDISNEGGFVLMDYDLIVIGAGTAGSNAAKAAIKIGARVAIVEEESFAGTCLARG